MNDDREALIERSIPFLEEVKDMTAGTETERWLNDKYGPGSELYETLAPSPPTTQASPGTPGR